MVSNHKRSGTYQLLIFLLTHVLEWLVLLIDESCIQAKSESTVANEISKSVPKQAHFLCIEIVHYLRCQEVGTDLQRTLQNEKQNIRYDLFGKYS